VSSTYWPTVEGLTELPSVMLGVMWIVFGAHFGRGVAAYPLYLLVGIVTVGFFLTATRYLMTLFQTNRSVLLDSTVPRETLIVIARSGVRGITESTSSNAIDVICLRQLLGKLVKDMRGIPVTRQ